nr:unnamed protein product [Callosobruchus chinensis]
MILSNIVYVIGAATLFLYLYVQWVYGTWKRRGFNYLEPEFFFGNTKKAYKRQITRCISTILIFFLAAEQYAENYNEMKERGWKFGGIYETLRPVFIPVDLDIVKCILQSDFWHFPNHGFYWNEKVDPLSANLFNLENERWKKARAQVTPAFTTGKIKMMSQTILKCSEDLMDVFRDHTRSQTPMDARDVLGRFATDVIGSTAFGIDANSLKDPKATFKMYAEQVFSMGLIQVLKLFLKMNLPRSILHLIGLRTNSKDTETFFMDVISDTINYREENRVSRKDLLHLLLQLKNTGTLIGENYVPSNDNQGSFLSSTDITCHAYTFFVAAYETSASAMTFALYELGLNQKLQNDLREEILSEMEKHKGRVSYDAIMKMNLLDKVVLETLRRYAIAPHLPRKCAKRYKVPNTELYLEPDDLIAVPIQAIHMDPEYYPEPEKFEPERFSDANKLKRHPMAYIPFGGGPRQCVGWRFALLEIKIALAAILSQYRVTINSKTECPIRTMGLVTVACLLAAAPLLVYVYLKWVYGTWKRRGLNYLEPEFFFGNTRRVMTREISRGEQFVEIYNQMKRRGWKHGGYFEMIKPMYTPIDLDLLKLILQKDFWHFPNHGAYVNEKADPPTANLFNLEDEKWKTTRAKLTPAFSSGKLKMMFQTIWKCSEALDDVLVEIEKSKEPMDTKDVLSRFTTDVIANVGFGIECNSLKDPESLFRVYGKRIFEVSFWKMLKRMAVVMIPRSILKLVHFRSSDPEIINFFSDIVSKTTCFREENKIFRKDFMHVLLQLKNRGRITEDDYVPSKEDKGEFLSNDELTTHCLTFFAAGFETSATTMTFALYELAKNQEIQDKLREEILSTLKRHGGNMTYEAMNEITYLDKVFHETLRRHPAASALARVCSKRYQIPDTQVVLEPGDRIMIPVMAIHMDPEHYPEPEKFDPERFSEEVKSQRHPMAYLPFGEGPRLCIGMRLGLIEAKVGLAAIISKFKVTLNKKTESPMVYAVDSLVTSARGGIWLDVHKIKNE